MSLDYGITGTKRASFDRANLRALFDEIKNRFPRANDDDLEKRFVEAGMDDEHYQIAALKKVFRDTLAAVTPKMRRKPPSPQARIKADAANLNAAKVALLDLITPGGKALRFCTGAECAGFGDWYARLARKVGRARIVGQVLDETAVRKIYATATKVVPRRTDAGR